MRPYRRLANGNTIAPQADQDQFKESVLKAVRTTLFALVTLFSATAGAQQTIAELERQAGEGSLEAQMELANRYYKGEGVEQDLGKAATWYKKLADQEFAHAQLTLGLMYIKGEGVEQDDKKAIEWLERAAAQRLSGAQYLLGLAYEEGHGVEADLPTAYMWYEIAAALTHAHAEAARERIKGKLSEKQIKEAEQKASQWWLQHHH